MAKELEAKYPVTAAELRQLVTTALNPPHPTRGQARPVESNLKSAIDDVLSKVTGLALAGGFAVIQWIDIRKTYDADFVVMGPTFDKLGEIFPDGELKDIIFTVNIQGEDVDFLQPELFPWTAEAMHAAAFKDFMGHKIKVLTPEFLILYKFAAARDRDLTDISALLTLPGVPEKAQRLIAKYMPNEMEDFKQLVQLAEYGL